MDLNKSKMKLIKTWLELEPNFPVVATPQSSELIIYIISYAYNLFTATWGMKKVEQAQQKCSSDNLVDCSSAYHATGNATP